MIEPAWLLAFALVTFVMGWGGGGDVKEYEGRDLKQEAVAEKKLCEKELPRNIDCVVKVKAEVEE